MQINSFRVIRETKWLCILIYFIATLSFLHSFGQIQLENEQVKAKISKHGTIEQLSFKVKANWKPIDFLGDDQAGPRFHVDHQPLFMDKDPNSNTFYALQFGILYKLNYELHQGAIAIKASIENRSTFDFTPKSAGLIMGIDAFMETFPQWNTKHFPTLLRAEKDHFWGYAMSPEGSIVGIASPDPIASWSINYFKDHYIKTFNLDLLNKTPLPPRHPQTLNKLKPGEKKQWIIYLCAVAKEEALKPKLASLCHAPMIDAKGAYILYPAEQRVVDIYSADQITAVWLDPNGGEKRLQAIPAGIGKWKLTIQGGEHAGQCRLVVSAGGKQSEALFYQRKPWSYYLSQARDQTLLMPPQSAIYAESYYSAFSIYLGKKYVPNPAVDYTLDSLFHNILPKMFSYTDGKLSVIPNVRVQSLFTAIGVLTDAYEANHRIEDLDLAARLADHLIENYQKTDAAYRTVHGTYYTAVIYGTKPMFELVAIERQLGKKNVLWRQRAERHYQSAKRAVDDLLKRLDNIETEGEQTFEDGMISCSALQLGFYALQTADSQERKRYTKGLAYMLEKHRCLEQTVVPDARMNGGTLRFWEAWYDIRLKPHVMNSPHGWSSWKTYATYYMYLLNGEEKWLKETMDAVGSAMQVVDVNNAGYLNWGFIQDPFVEATFAIEDPSQKGKSIFTTGIIGEQYMPLTLRWRKDHGGDATVHEHFKMLAEVALPNAFVVEHADGTYSAYNCTVVKKQGILKAIPYEKCVTSVHFNLISAQKVHVGFCGKSVTKQLPKGMNWVRLNFN